MVRDAVFRESVANSVRTFYDGLTIHYKDIFFKRLENHSEMQIFFIRPVTCRLTWLASSIGIACSTQLHRSSAAIESKAAAGSPARVTGRPMTICEAPFANACAGVAIRL